MHGYIDVPHTQAGICSFSAIMLMVCGGNDQEVVGEAKEAAGAIFDVIDLVLMVAGSIS